MADRVRVDFQFVLGQTVRMAGVQFHVVRRIYEEGTWSKVHAYDLEPVMGGSVRRAYEPDIEEVTP